MTKTEPKLLVWNRTKVGSLLEVADLMRSALSSVGGLLDRVVRGASRERRLVATEQLDGTFLFFERRRGKIFKIDGPVGHDPTERFKKMRDSRQNTELRIQSEKLIVTNMTLPLGAKIYAEKVIEHRLERLTPWPLEQIIYGFTLSNAAGSNGQLEAVLVATSREILNETLKSFAATGCKPTVLGSTADPLESSPQIDLFRSTKDGPSRNANSNSEKLVLFVLAASIVFFALSVWFNANEQSKRAELEEQTLQMRNRMAGVSAASNSGPEVRILQRKTVEAAYFTLLNRLADSIPTDTYLSALEIQPSQIRLSGNSANASGLIGVLENRMGLVDANFEAPVTRLADGRDQFSIVAKRGTSAALPP